MNVTITGASGLVGANLAVLLREAGHTVKCTRRGGSKTTLLDGVGVEWVEAELGDVAALTRAFDQADAVFHCAAAVSIRKKATDEMVRTNVGGTSNVIDAMKQSGAGRLIHCSSVVAVALTEDGRPSDETAAWNFDRHGLDDGYATTKHQAEGKITEAVAAGLDAVIVNPTFMFGPYDQRPSSGGMIIEVMKRKVPGYPGGINNFVDVRDVCRGMIAAWQKGKKGERYILGHENLPYAEIFRRIAEIGGVRPPRFKMPRVLATPAGWVGDLVEKITGKEPLVNSNTISWGYARNFQFRSDKAKRDLGYAPGPVENGIRDAIDWFRKHGMLA
jgi:dihydroflavonol-4-reductase